MRSKTDNSFKTEKELVNYLVANISLWVEDSYSDTVQSCSVNDYLGFRKFGPNRPSIDILVTTESGKRIGIECKNPKQAFHETSRAVSQLLSYAVLAEELGNPLDELALVSSDKHNISCKIIEKYNLPIRTFYLDRSTHGEIRA